MAKFRIEIFDTPRDGVRYSVHALGVDDQPLAREELQRLDAAGEQMTLAGEMAARVLFALENGLIPTTLLLYEAGLLDDHVAAGHVVPPKRHQQ